MLHANCNAFVSVQGGNSVIASYFAGTHVILLLKAMKQSMMKSTVNCIRVWLWIQKMMFSTASRHTLSY